MARRSTRDSDRSVPADDVVDWDLTHHNPEPGLFKPATYDPSKLHERTRTIVIVLLVLLTATVSAITAIWCEDTKLGIGIVSSQAGLCTLGLKWYFRKR